MSGPSSPNRPGLSGMQLLVEPSDTTSDNARSTAAPPLTRPAIASLQRPKRIWRRWSSARCLSGCVSRLQGDTSVRARRLAGVLWCLFLLAGLSLMALGADRAWLHAMASAWFWTWAWVVTGNARVAFAGALLPSIGWELVAQPMDRGTWSIDVDHVIADIGGMCFAWLLLSALRQLPHRDDKDG